jgi:hypothetical protein
MVPTRISLKISSQFSFTSLTCLRFKSPHLFDPVSTKHRNKNNHFNFSAFVEAGHHTGRKEIKQRVSLRVLSNAPVKASPHSDYRKCGTEPSISRNNKENTPPYTNYLATTHTSQCFAYHQSPDLPSSAG